MRSAAVVAAVLLAFMATTAQGDYPFPYSGCVRSLRRSRYSVEPITLEVNKHTYCWTITYNKQARCSNATDETEYCCRAALDKFMLDVKASCVPGTRATATLNGKALEKPKIDSPPNAQPDQVTLHVANLGLNKATAQDAQVCLTLAGTCDTLEKLLPSSSWQVALWDDNHKCCPVSSAPPPSPPPSPSPPAPPPPEPRGCTTCWRWFLTRSSDGSSDGITYFDDRAKCNAASAAAFQLIRNMLSTYPPDTIDGFGGFICSKNTAEICGRFNSDAGGRDIFDAISPILFELVWGSSGDGCSRELEGLDMRFETYILPPEPPLNWYSPYQCGELVQSMACREEAPPPAFPSCECNRTLDTMPFALVQDEPFGENMACYGVRVVEPSVPSPCNGVEVLNKVEFYLKHELRWRVQQLWIRLGRGIPQRKAQSWGAPADNTLKVTNLDWTAGDVRALLPSICIELKPPTTLDDLCPDDAAPTLYAALFDGGQDCCPVSGFDTA